MCAVKPGNKKYELLRNPKKVKHDVLLGFNWHLKEGDHEVEYEPDVDHLDVRGLWKVFRHSDKHCCQNLGEKQ